MEIANWQTDNKNIASLLRKIKRMFHPFGLNFHTSLYNCIAQVDQNKDISDQYENIFRDPDYILKEQSNIDLVEDDQVSENAF